MEIKCDNTTQESFILRFDSLDLKEVPAAVLSSRNAQELYLDYNNIKEIKEDVCSNCQYLQKLSIIGNDLHSVTETIGSLLALQELYLNENNLKVLPNCIEHCSQLAVLNVVGNKISHLPKEIGCLKNLKEIYADENELVDLPSTFGSLCCLEIVELSNNQIEELPENIGLLNKLKVLNLSNNKLESLPDSFGELSSLQELELSGNNLTYLTDTFSSCHCLRTLFVDGNIMEVLPEWINQLSNIETLSVKDNRLRVKPLGESFGKNCSKLIDLNLAGNFITEMPETIGELKCLETIHLGSALDELERRNFQNGNILWKIPDSFTDLVSLKRINLDENQLCQLPSQFGKLVNLEYLNLGQNRLPELPYTFCQLRSLKLCILSINNLEALPANFGDLQNLEELRLDNNKILELPKSFSRLTNLQTLDLFNNRLTEIPKCVQNLPNVLRFDISENPLPMHHLRVPDKKVCHSYAPRDPKLKDNWRGRPRQDLVGLDIIEAEVPGDEYGQIPDTPEPEPEVTTYNYNALQMAVSRNMSLWKSHTESKSTREKIQCDAKPVQHRNGFVKSSWELQKELKQESKETVDVMCGKDKLDHDLQEHSTPMAPPELDDKHASLWTNGLIPAPDSCEVKRTDLVITEGIQGEDWDKECEDVKVPDGPYSIPYMRQNSPRLTFKGLGDEVHSTRRPRWIIVQGQFDDADGDCT